MRFLRDNGLSLALAAAFLISIGGMLAAGHAVDNRGLVEHGQAPISLGAYVLSADFFSAVFENWESEFLQMSTYVILTAMLFQRGSAESRDPDKPFREDDAVPPEWAGSRLRHWLYAHGLGLALGALFIASFTFHWLASSRAANEDAVRHGGQAISAIAYLGDARFWFESFQNWQSEFLSTAVLIVLSIFLRHKGSPVSKPLSASNSETA